VRKAQQSNQKNQGAQCDHQFKNATQRGTKALTRCRK
jgi:hypothetical protein